MSRLSRHRVVCAPAVFRVLRWQLLRASIHNHDRAVQPAFCASPRLVLCATGSLITNSARGYEAPVATDIVDGEQSYWPISYFHSEVEDMENTFEGLDAMSDTYVMHISYITLSIDARLRRVRFLTSVFDAGVCELRYCTPSMPGRVEPCVY